jgi:hypothetical protein
MTLDEILSFHRATYHPGNAVLVATGGVSHDAIVEMANAMPARRRRKANVRKALVPQLPHASYRKKDAGSSILILFRPPEDVWDEMRFGFMFEVLCGMPFGILFQTLRNERRIIYSIGYEQNDWPMRDACITIESAPHHIRQIEDAIFNGIDRLRSGDYPKAAFDVVLARRAVFFATIDEISYCTFVPWLKNSWVEGDLEDIDRKAHTLSTTREDLSRIADTYLRREHAGRIIVTPRIH